jgi:hypothetical protein
MRCYQRAIIQFIMFPTRYHAQTTHIFSPEGVYSRRRTRTRAHPAPAPGPAHAHALTVAHAVALTSRATGDNCRTRQIDVLTTLNRCATRPSCRERNLRRLAHDGRQKGRKGLEEARAYRGHSDGSREVPMVRTPADPLGSRTPSRGRSQRRDTGRGPAFRCMRISTHIIISSKADERHSRRSDACAPKTQSEYLQELMSAVNLVPGSSSGT